jgi:hypothetical protein
MTQPVSTEMTTETDRLDDPRIAENTTCRLLAFNFWAIESPGIDRDSAIDTTITPRMLINWKDLFHVETWFKQGDRMVLM